MRYCGLLVTVLLLCLCSEAVSAKGKGKGHRNIKNKNKQTKDAPQPTLAPTPGPTPELTPQSTPGPELTPEPIENEEEGQGQGAGQLISELVNNAKIVVAGTAQQAMGSIQSLAAKIAHKALECASAVDQENCASKPMWQLCLSLANPDKKDDECCNTINTLCILPLLPKTSSNPQ